MKKTLLIISILFFSLSSLYAAITTRSDISYFQDEMDMNLTKRHHIDFFQDEMDMNLTKRHHIEKYQLLSIKERKSFFFRFIISFI